MMSEHLEFSEFSYGYAFTVDFTRSAGITGLPLFPSLVQEGASGGGYDVSIPLTPAIPLLLQFKVPQVMNRTSALKPAPLSLPYYRAHLRTRVSQPGMATQHEMLCSHQSHGGLVFYVCPRFHRLTDLEQSFLIAGRIVERSAFIRPLDVGPLDDRAHHVAYDHVHDEGWARSEPKRLESSVASKEFVLEVSAEWERSRRRWDQAGLEFDTLLERFVEAATMPEARWPIERRMAPRELATQLRERFSAPAAVALFARLGLGAELYFVTLTSELKSQANQL